MTYKGLVKCKTFIYIKLLWGDTAVLGEKYNHWIATNEPTRAELEEQKKHTFLYEPVVRLIVPTFNTLGPFLCELIESVRQQTYPKWELCITAGSKQRNPIEKIIFIIQKIVI